MDTNIISPPLANNGRVGIRQWEESGGSPPEGIGCYRMGQKDRQDIEIKLQSASGISLATRIFTIFTH